MPWLIKWPFLGLPDHCSYHHQLEKKMLTVCHWYLLALLMVLIVGLVSLFSHYPSSFLVNNKHFKQHDVAAAKTPVCFHFILNLPTYHTKCFPSSFTQKMCPLVSLPRYSYSYLAATLLVFAVCPSSAHLSFSLIVACLVYLLLSGLQLLPHKPAWDLSLCQMRVPTQDGWGWLDETTQREGQIKAVCVYTSMCMHFDGAAVKSTVRQ